LVQATLWGTHLRTRMSRERKTMIAKLQTPEEAVDTTDT
jgi:hypothetical protein